MKPKSVERIADAILYEGYVLYPYRASALKNGRRWNFGVLYPSAYAEAQQGSDTSTVQCTCFARGANVSVTVRFLQLVTRDTLDAQGNAIHTWQEAIAREVEIALDCHDRGSAVHHFLFPAGGNREPAQGRDGEITGEIVRRFEQIEGAIDIGCQVALHDWRRISLRISNCRSFDSPSMSSVDWSTRESALLRSLVSTHAILHIPGGQFASVLDPPEELRELAAACANTGLWPVLASETAPPDTMLASPIILYDYPQIAPESAGALFDGTEIDEILSLRILALTDAEKQEMRDTDPRTRQILERTEALNPEQWLQLHGIMREKHTPEVPDERI